MSLKRQTASHQTAIGWPLLASEMALIAVTLSTVVALSRLFENNDYLAPTAGAALASHLLAMLLRRARLSTAVSLATSTVVMVFFVANVRYGSTTTARAPTGETWSTLGNDLSQAWDAFSIVKAPTIALEGFIVSLMVVVWTVATLADLAAFRIRTVVETVLPSTILIIFVSLLGVPELRGLTTLLFLAAVAMFVLLSRITFPLSAAVPVGSTRTRQPSAQLRAGMALISLTLVAGLTLGPMLPGADAEAVIDWKALDGGGGSRVTLSPLVDARGRLVEQTDIELFRVRTDSNVGAYWRTTSLDTYDGGVWGSSYSYSDARGTLSSPDSTQGEILDLEVSVTNLGDIWIPAPYQPVTISGVDAKWDPQSSTLVTIPGQFTDDITYSLTAVVPEFNPARLRASQQPIPDDIRERYSGVPADLSDSIVELSRQLGAGLDSDYDKALAIQDFFRDNFQYSTEVAGGHDGDRIENFLFIDRVGYCEQFAGTYALLARAAGLPTRVAVGFTPGQRVGKEFVVKGENYHAWPEVWIGGAWVQFEPTPGRGSPQGEAWTGVAPGQEGGFTGRSEEDEAEDEGSGLVLPDLSGQNFENLPDFETDPTGGTGVGTDGPLLSPWISRPIAAIGIVAAVSAALWWGMPALVARRRRKRLAEAGGVRGRVEVAWHNLTDSLRQTGHAPAPAETRREFVSRVGPLGVVDNTRLRQVALLVDASIYGRSEPDDEVEAHTHALVAELEHELAERATASERARRRLDPRLLLDR
ncbi:MAG: DUF4129 domain-containing protein [Actinomycetia bacterium]|nr:DUF4129 domain-containing protein [Actinomycetes bacterium]